MTTLNMVMILFDISNKKSKTAVGQAKLLKINTKKLTACFL